jgi:hypothetical protein
VNLQIRSQAPGAHAASQRREFAWLFAAEREAGTHRSRLCLRGRRTPRTAGPAAREAHTLPEEIAEATLAGTRRGYLAELSTGEMEAAIAISYPLVEESPSPLLIGWIRDQAEHYGKLVSNCRAVGIVPPVSRQPASQ